MRTTWNGSLSFGLVSIPVGLAPATKPAARQSDVSFRMLHRECGTPIRQKRWCPQHDREVSPDEIVKGWEVSKGQFVLVEDEDLEALERTDDSRAIEITQFVRLEDVDPIFFDRTYFLVPGQAPAQRRPYALLLQAMRDSSGDALALETLYLAEDVYSQAEIEEALDGIEVKAPELKLAEQVIGSLEADFDAATLVSEYRRDLRALLEAKLNGEEIAVPEPQEAEAPVVDLLEALRASVAAASGKDAKQPSGSKAAARPRTKAAAARKS